MIGLFHPVVKPTNTPHSVGILELGESMCERMHSENRESHYTSHVWDCLSVAKQLNMWPLARLPIISLIRYSEMILSDALLDMCCDSQPVNGFSVTHTPLLYQIGQALWPMQCLHDSRNGIL